MDITEARELVQEHYDKDYPDCETEIRIIESSAGRALYAFFDDADEGGVLCSEDMAEQFVAVLGSDVCDKCNALPILDLFTDNAVSNGFAPSARRTVTWHDVLEMLSHQCNYRLDEPAMAHIITNGTTWNVPFNLSENGGIKLTINLKEE
jgi:hypothetical protein